MIEPGPDARRYWHAATGGTVPRPFHLRWLLPRVCGQHPDRWWAAWFAGWVLCAGGMLGWRFAAGDPWPVAVAAAVLLCGLPGILGPKAVIPIGVDLPATGLGLCGLALLEAGWWPAALAVLLVAAGVRETVPVWVALWAWNPIPLIALLVPAVASRAIPTGPDPLGPQFDEIAARPIATALQHHAGQWRDAWIMVAPWGVTLAALYSPSWQLALILAAAYTQLLVATDTVRLVHHAAGPPMAAAAATVIPVPWLALAAVVHVFWWRTPHRL